MRTTVVDNTPRTPCDEMGTNGMMRAVLADDPLPGPYSRWPRPKAEMEREEARKWVG